FRYTPGIGFEDLDPIPTRNSQGWAINDHGDVVGTFSTTAYNHVFVRTDADGFLDLNDRLAAGGDGWILVAAYGIKSAGEIVGHGEYLNQGQPRGFKLIPVNPDTTPPVITIVSPQPITYTLGERVTAQYSCMDAESGVASCVGSLDNGA